MRHCELKFVYNKAGVKSTVLQNCTGKKNTPWQTKPHQKLMEHKICLEINLYFDQTTPWQGVYFFTHTVIKWLLYD